MMLRSSLILYLLPAIQKSFQYSCGKKEKNEKKRRISCGPPLIIIISYLV